MSRDHPADGLRRALRIQRVRAMRVRQRQQLQQLRVVVQHLLEVRHQPDRIGGVSGIAAAEVVVDAALRHALSASGAAPPGPPARRCGTRSATGSGRSAGWGISARPAARHAPDRSAAAAPPPRASRCTGVGRSPGLALDIPASTRRSAAVFFATISWSVRYASDTPCSTWRNDGRPQRGSGGKYVPPQNGAPSGAMNMVSGQPPCSPSACSADM